MLQADQIWDVRSRDRAQIEAIRREKAELSAELMLIKRLEALQHAPGYQDFVKSVDGLRRRVVDGLIACTDGSAAMRIQQGRAQALGEVMMLIVKSVEKQKSLSEAISRLEAAEEAIKKHQPERSKP